MKTVTDNVNTIIIKNSRFICLLYYVDDVSKALELLNNSKFLYKDATHYCYAYIINYVSKCSDDGEPSGTAGMPMLQVLKRNALNNVLCIVIRYFGKILLGANGLVRAYSNSVTECLKNSIVIRNPGYLVTIVFDYNQLKKMDYFLKDISNIEKNFNDKVIYKFCCSVELYDKLVENGCCDVEINSDVYI